MHVLQDSSMTSDEPSTYAADVSELQKEVDADHSDKKIKKLMKKTYGGRQEWIKNETPPIAQVIDMFQPLEKFRFVSLNQLKFFCQLTHHSRLYYVPFLSCYACL